MYQCSNIEEGNTIAVVAHSRKSATKRFYENAWDLWIDDDYIWFLKATKIRRVKEINVSNLEYWVVDNKWAIINEIYDWAEDECDKCKKYSSLHKSNDGNFAYCMKCE